MEWDSYDSLRVLAHAFVGVGLLLVALVTTPSIFGLRSGGPWGLEQFALFTLALILEVAAFTIYWILREDSD